MKSLLLLLLLAPALCLGQQQQQEFDVDYTDECPESFGFYADAVQCDRYYECKNGEILDHYCPDGLVFDESSSAFAKCSFPFSVDCQDRPEMQRAQPTEFCPRRNGYFPHRDPKVCDKFYFCVDGVHNEIACPQSLIFDPTKGQCAFSDQVNRRGCSSEEVFQFTCPSNAGSPHEHPRYPDPNDCQYFYICINGERARRNGCTVGLVFNPETLSCERPGRVRGRCSTWYNETFLEEQVVARAPPKPTGVPVKLQPGRKRVAVRRRRPVSSSSSAAATAAAAGRVPTALATGNRVQQQQPRDDVAVRGSVPRRPVEQASSSSAAVRNRNRSRVRTRVRRPTPVVAEPAEEPRRQETRGPPKFALSSDEAIQQFRQSNRFVPESPQSGSGGGGGGGRLTVLSTGSRAAPRPQTSFRQQEEDDVDFAAFPAVPSRTPPRASLPRRQQQVVEDDFDRFQSTRTSLPSSRRPPQQQQPASEDFAPRDEDLFNSFRSRRPAGAGAATAAAALAAVPAVPAAAVVEEEASFHTDPYQTDFEEEGVRTRSRVAARARPAAAASSSPARSRLEVTSIKVAPQFDLRSEEPDDFEIRRVPQGRQRSRVRARQQQQQ